MGSTPTAGLKKSRTMDLDLDDDEPEDNTSDESKEQGLYSHTINLCGGPDLVELFGGSGSGKSEFSTQVVKSALKGDKDVLVIDTERNIGDMDEISGADYVYIPEWHDVYSYIVEGGLRDDAFGENTTNVNSLPSGYDVVVLDSIGFPALVQYAQYRVDNNSDQFEVFLELQAITGELKKYSQRNDSLVLVTNQPKSELSGEEDPNPFGDKSIFGFKEIWKTVKASTSEIKTTCEINSFRSRQAGKGKTLFKLDIDDSGTDVTTHYDEEVDEEWV